MTVLKALLYSLQVRIVIDISRQGYVFGILPSLLQFQGQCLWSESAFENEERHK